MAGGVLRAQVDAPAIPAPLPGLTLPALRYPAIAVPRVRGLAAGPSASAAPGVIGGRTAGPTRGAYTRRVVTRQLRRVTRVGTVRRVLVKRTVPVVNSSYSTVPPPHKAPARSALPGSAAARALAGAL